MDGVWVMVVVLGWFVVLVLVLGRAGRDERPGGGLQVKEEREREKWKS